MRKKSWKNLTDTDLLEMLRNGESRVAIANRYGVSKYVLDERVKKAQMQMHIPPGRHPHRRNGGSASAGYRAGGVLGKGGVHTS